MKQKTSHIWNYFTEINETQAKCLICTKKYSRKGRTTTSLKNHLRSIHPEKFQEFENTTMNESTPITKQEQHDQGNSKSEEDPLLMVHSIEEEISLEPCLQQYVGWESYTEPNEIDRLIAEMIALEDLPFDFVEGNGFCRLMNTVAPGYKLRGSQFFTTLVCDDLYNTVAIKIYKSLEEFEKLSFTSDIWSDPSSGTSVFNLTAHGVTNDFERTRIILKCQIIEDQLLSLNFESILKEWGIKHDTVHCMVRDRDTNVIEAMQLFGVPDFNCIIHQIQSCIKNVVMSEDWIQEVIEKINKVTTHFNHSLMAQEEFKNIQAIKMKQAPLSPIPDCNTRWHSSFYMIERFLKIKDALLLYLSTKQIVSFSPDDWLIMEILLKLLKPFEEITNELTDSRNTISSVIPLMHVALITLKCEEEKPNISEKFKIIIKKVICIINDKLSSLSKNSLCSVSTYLDPRFKAKFFNSIEMEIVHTTIINLCKNRNVHAEEGYRPKLKKRKTNHQIDASSNSPSCSQLLQSILSSSDDENEQENEDDKSAVIKEILQNYNKEKRLSLEEDPLNWWRLNGYKYPMLIPIVRQYLSTPASCATSEQLFNGASVIHHSDKRKGLHWEKVSKVLFLKYNLPSISYEYQ